MSQRLAAIVLLGVLFFTLSGCSTLLSESNNRPSDIIGKWNRQGATGTRGYYIHFKNDRTFELDYNGDGIKDIWGAYDLVFENMIKITDAKGEMDTLCIHSGFHQYTFEDNQLKFSPFADQCLPRKGSLYPPTQKTTGLPVDECENKQIFCSGDVRPFLEKADRNPA